MTPAGAPGANAAVTVNSSTSNSVPFTAGAAPTREYVRMGERLIAIESPQVPEISGLSTALGLPGTEVTISGLNFGTATGAVTFDGASAAVTQWSATSIRATVPVEARTGNLVVAANGFYSNGKSFAVPPVGEITLNPASLSFSQDPGVGQFTVNAPSTLTWTVASEAAWVTLKSVTPANQTGTGVVQYNVQQGDGGAAGRSGSIRVAWTSGGAGKEARHTVLQCGAVSLGVEPSSVYSMTPGGTQQFNLRVNGTINNAAAVWYAAAGDGSFSATTPGLYTAPSSIPPGGRVIRVEARYAGCGGRTTVVEADVFFNWYPLSQILEARFSNATGDQGGGGGYAAGSGQSVGMQITSSPRLGIGTYTPIDLYFGDTPASPAGSCSLQVDKSYRRYFMKLDDGVGVEAIPYGLPQINWSGGTPTYTPVPIGILDRNSQCVMDWLIPNGQPAHYEVNTGSGTQWEAYYTPLHFLAGYTGRKRLWARQLYTTGEPEPWLEIGWVDVPVVSTLRPTAGITAPATEGATVAGTVTLTGYALDNPASAPSRIESVRVYVDKMQVGTASYGQSMAGAPGCPFHPSCPNVGWSLGWNTTGVSNGTHKLRVVVVDADAPWKMWTVVERTVNVQN